MELLTPVDEALLDALATYGLLTVAQGVRLGLANDKHVRERLNRFKKLGLARRLKTAKRMFPYVYWLTPKGAGVLQELAAESGQPCKVTARDVDYRPSEHLLQRIGIVDCHIALRLWAEDVGAVVDEVRQEFDPHTKLGKALRLEAVGRVYEPDALAMFRTPDGAAWLVAFEVETGGGSERLDNFTKHLAARLDALEAATMERALKRQAGQKRGRMLFVFASEAMQARAQKLAERSDGEAWRLVHFNALPRLRRSFVEGWWQKGEPLPFLATPSLNPPPQPSKAHKTDFEASKLVGVKDALFSMLKPSQKR